MSSSPTLDPLSTGDDDPTVFEASEKALGDDPSQPGSGAPPKKAMRGRRGLSLLMAAIGIGAAMVYVTSVRSVSTISGMKAGGQPLGDVPFGEVDGRLVAIVQHFLDEPIALVLAAPGSAQTATDEMHASRRELGFSVDSSAASAEAKTLGKTGRPLSDLLSRTRARAGLIDIPLPVQIDRKKALEFFTEVKDRLDRGALDARLDLEQHTIAPSRAGYLVRVYDSMVALEYAARAGEKRVQLASVVTEPRVREEDLKDVDISTVLGFWETKYSVSAIDSDRTYNLKVGADHLNGHILKPNEVFSFNEVVGDRTEKEGYRVAPVISGGELIDGLAGGMCQIASTLHAASFFAGLDIVSSTPHSRPSAYIPMGLDSTVVYPTTDLKLKNPYDFPVVMHYQVNQGSVKVELLGKERPNRVIFEREIKTEVPFGVETRSDPLAPAGQKYVVQEGYPGFTLFRRRYIFAKDNVPKSWSGIVPLAKIMTEKRPPIQPLSQKQWQLHYPATTQIVMIGSGPHSLKQKVPPPSHHIPPISPKDKPIFKMLK